MEIKYITICRLMQIMDNENNQDITVCKAPQIMANQNKTVQKQFAEYG